MYRHVSPSSQQPSAGIALLMVITVLVTLVIIAVPFAISMRHGHERTTSELARSQAEFESSLLIEAMKQALGETTPMLEQERWDKGERDLASDPRIDTLDEITLGESFQRRLEESWSQALGSDASGRADPRLVAHLQSLDARGLGLLGDDRGSIWTGVVEDANGKVNANGVSPFLLGNLMGAALLSEELDSSSPDISVEHVVGARSQRLANFPKDGGWIRIGAEVIRYDSFDGSTFRGCERSALGETPLKDNGTALVHEVGTPVIDYTAYKIATHIVAARPGFLTWFANLEDLRSIAGWGAGPGLLASRLDQIRPFLTVWSRRETASGWLAQQVIVNELPVGADPSTPDELQLVDQFNPSGTTAYFNPGTLLRISDGTNTVYQAVNHVGDSEGRQPWRYVTLAGRVDATAGEEGITFDGGEAMAEAFAPFPININTAPIEVIYACLANLHLRTAKEPEQIVTTEVAWMLAERIVDERGRGLLVDPDSDERQEGPFRHYEDYGKFLQRLEDEEEFLQGDQRAALYLNAVNPHNAQLAFGTAPWCFRTLDVYHLEARVAVNDRGGEQMATSIRREIAEIGSDGKTSWTLDSQEDFEARLAMGSGAKWTATGPRGVNYRYFRLPWTTHVQPALRAEQGYHHGVYPSTELSDENDERGDVQLEPSRIQFPRGLSGHFDSSLSTEGWRTDFTGAYTHPIQGVFTQANEKYCRSFTLSFWWRSFSDANWTAFDCGMLRHTNRFAIFVTEGLDGQELVFRVAGPTLEGRAVECFVPLERINYRPGNWYHIKVSCRGADPSLVELFVDGVALGDRRTLTWLTGGLSEEQEEIQVESTDGFSARGALLIGDEIVEYETLAGDSFRDCFRGARGTNDAAASQKLPGQGKQWPVGTPVKQLGYSAFLLQDVMKGGASLYDTLGRWSAVRIDNVDVETQYDETNFFLGVPPTQTTFTATILPLWGEDVTGPSGIDLQDQTGTAADAFSTSGIAILGCEIPQSLGSFQGQSSADGWVLGGWELVQYTRTIGDANVIEITKRNYESVYWDPADDYFLVTRHRRVDPNAIPPSETFTNLPAFLIPISIPATQGSQGDDYLNPAETGGEDITLIQRHPIDWNSDDNTYQEGDAFEEGDGGTRLVLGLPNQAGTEPVEVIRYDSIDRQNGAQGEMLFVADGEFVQRILQVFLPETTTTMGAPPGTQEVEDDESGQVTEPDQQTEDVTAPDTQPPEEDPPTDSSGQGDPENIEEVDPFLDDEILAVTDRERRSDYPPDEPDHKNPVPDDLAQWPWPSWGAAMGRVHTWYRGVHGTNDRHHADPADDERESILIPCFRATEGPAYKGQGTDEWVPGQPWIHLGARPLGRLDRITLTDGAAEEPRRFEALVRWADPYSRWAALDQFPEDRVKASEDVPSHPGAYRDEHRGLPRILRFPCGELPDELPQELEFAQSTVSSSGVVTAFLDEIHVIPLPIQLEPLLYVANEEGLTEQTADIRLALMGTLVNKDQSFAYHPECGLLDLDGELILWRDSTFESENVLVLERCVRGVLGTTSRPHPRGGSGRFVPGVPVTYIQGSATRDLAQIPVASLDERVWPREGLLRVVGAQDAELIHFTRRSREDFILPEAFGAEDAPDVAEGRAILRGRFGTKAIDHDDGTPVFFQPFRYWDRFLPRRIEEDESFSGIYDHPEGSYLELGQKLRAAYWHRLTWTEGTYEDLSEDRRSRQGASDTGGLHDILVLARFSTAVPWDSQDIVDLRTGTGTGGFGGGRSDTEDRSANRLYLFDDPEAVNRLGVESETAEFRVFFVFRPGAYIPQDSASGQTLRDEFGYENAWKHSPVLRSFTVDYTSRTSTLSRSVLR